MVDTRSPEQRRRIMQSVAQRDTGPELAVRKMVHALGYRFRLHSKDLPGRPDIVLRRHRKAIFVHGCYWHGHACKKGNLPKSKLDYWRPKIEGNKARDRRSLQALRALGWRALVVWQCEIRNPVQLGRRLHRFLESPTQSDRQKVASAISSRRPRRRSIERVS
jgi:DNA mismatch endonuclease (patch repair protein)